MPNWCSNALRLVGPGADDLLNHVAKDGDRFTDLFNRFVPMPAELRGLHRGSITIDGQVYRHWHEIMDPETDKRVCVGVTEAEIDALEVKYGARDWYEWALKHWGTKWDADGDRDGDRLVFDTAWSPPEAFVTRLSMTYPNITMILSYAECGMGYAGTIAYEAGAPTILFDYEGAFWDESGPADEDGYPPLVPAVESHLTHHGLHTGG